MSDYRVNRRMVPIARPASVPKVWSLLAPGNAGIGPYTISYGGDIKPYEVDPPADLITTALDEGADGKVLQ